MVTFRWLLFVNEFQFKIKIQIPVRDRDLKKGRCLLLILKLSATCHSKYSFPDVESREIYSADADGAASGGVHQHSEAHPRGGGRPHQRSLQEGVQPGPRPQEAAGQDPRRGQGLCWGGGDGAGLLHGHGHGRGGEHGRDAPQLVPQLGGAPGAHRGGGVAAGAAPGAARRDEGGGAGAGPRADLLRLVTPQLMADTVITVIQTVIRMGFSCDTLCSSPSPSIPKKLVKCCVVHPSS